MQLLNSLITRLIESGSTRKYPGGRIGILSGSKS